MIFRLNSAAAKIVPLFFLLLAGCNADNEKPTAPVVDVRQSEYDPKSLELSIVNSTNKMLCISAVDIDSEYKNLKIEQNGKSVPPNTQSNRAARFLNGVNVLEPIILILPGKNQFWYDLRDYKLASGEFSFQNELKFFECRQLFEGKTINWLAVTVKSKGVSEG